MLVKKMKTVSALALLGLSLTCTVSVAGGMQQAESMHADNINADDVYANKTGVVVKAADDNTIGKAAGGITTFLVGGAISGGPVGALIGGVAGIWLGGETQHATGASEQRYTVKLASGELREYRSPNQTFAIGDAVEVDGIRLQPVTRF